MIDRCCVLYVVLVMTLTGVWSENAYYNSIEHIKLINY